MQGNQECGVNVANEPVGLKMDGHLEGYIGTRSENMDKRKYGRVGVSKY